MDKLKFIYTVFLILFVSLSVSGQEHDYKENYYAPDDAKFEQFVREAYGAKADELIFNNEIRYLELKDFFTNRLLIVDRNPKFDLPDWFTELAEIGELGYVSAPNYTDANFNPKAFNPFYYKINYLITDTLQWIRISGTHYYIKVKPFDVQVINKLRNE